MLLARLVYRGLIIACIGVSNLRNTLKYVSIPYLNAKTFENFEYKVLVRLSLLSLQLNCLRRANTLSVVSGHGYSCGCLRASARLAV